VSEKQREATVLILYIIGAILVIYSLLNVGIAVWCMFGGALEAPEAMVVCTDGRLRTFSLEIIAAAGALWGAQALRSGGSK
jgi:hypothetical protein